MVQSFTARTFLIATLAGGFAGTSIDLVLFPVDSLKTRLQASHRENNFVKSAENVSRYRGLASAMAGAFPCAATFWLSYEYSKFLVRKNVGGNIHVQHIMASTCAEICQALVRCPFEVVK